MDIVLLLFRQSLVMFIYLLIGYLMFKKHLLTTQGSGEMGKLLLYVITPVVIMNSYARDFTLQMLTEILLSFAAAAGSLLLSMAVSTLVFKKRSAICQFGASFSNAGFMGIPLAQMPLKELFTSGLTYLCCLVRLIAIPLLTIALLTLIPAGYMTIRLAVLIVASAPVGANVAIFAQMFHKDYTGAVRDICLSTVLSIASMPLIVGLANRIWV